MGQRVKHALDSSEQERFEISTVPLSFTHLCPSNGSKVEMV